MLGASLPVFGKDFLLLSVDREDEPLVHSLVHGKRDQNAKYLSWTGVLRTISVLAWINISPKVTSDRFQGMNS